MSQVCHLSVLRVYPFHHTHVEGIFHTEQATKVIRKVLSDIARVEWTVTVIRDEEVWGRRDEQSSGIYVFSPASHHTSGCVWFSEEGDQ